MSKGYRHTLAPLAHFSSSGNVQYCRATRALRLVCVVSQIPALGPRAIFSRSGLRGLWPWCGSGLLFDRHPCITKADFQTTLVSVLSKPHQDGMPREGFVESET